MAAVFLRFIFWAVLGDGLCGIQELIVLCSVQGWLCMLKIEARYRYGSRCWLPDTAVNNHTHTRAHSRYSTFTWLGDHYVRPSAPLYRYGITKKSTTHHNTIKLYRHMWILNKLWQFLLENCLWRCAVLKTNIVSDFLAKAHIHFFRNSSSHRHGGHSTGLSASDAFFYEACPNPFQTPLRNLQHPDNTM